MYIQFTKDIKKIRNTIFLGLTLREIIIGIFTIGIGLLLFFRLKNYLPADIVSYIVIPVVLLGAFFMFYKKNDMPFEKVVYYKAKRILFGCKIRRFETENVGGIKDEKVNKNKSKKD